MKEKEEEKKETIKIGSLVEYCFKGNGRYDLYGLVVGITKGFSNPLFDKRTRLGRIIYTIWWFDQNGFRSYVSPSYYSEEFKVLS